MTETCRLEHLITAAFMGICVLHYGYSLKYRVNHKNNIILPSLFLRVILEYFWNNQFMRLLLLLRLVFSIFNIRAHSKFKVNVLSICDRPREKGGCDRDLSCALSERSMASTILNADH